jgi:hypothetical protein
MFATLVLFLIVFISYPFYLWHWPLLSFARIVEGETPPPRTRALAVFASFLLASLTYLLVERPIRFGKISAAKTSMPLIILMGAVGCAGLYVYKEYGLPFRHKGLEDIVAAATDFDQENYASLTKYGEGIDELEQSILVIGKPGAATTALVGDSTMQQYIPRVRRLAERNAIDLDNNRVVFAIAGGLPVPDIWSDFDPVQAAAWTKILPALSGNAVKTVAIAAYWTAFFKFAGFYVRSIGPDKLLGESETATAQASRIFRFSYRSSFEPVNASLWCWKLRARMHSTLTSCYQKDGRGSRTSQQFLRFGGRRWKDSTGRLAKNLGWLRRRQVHGLSAQWTTFAMKTLALRSRKMEC